MKPPSASAASDMDQRRKAAPRRRDLEAAGIATAPPEPAPAAPSLFPSPPSDTFALKFESDRTRPAAPKSWNNSSAIATTRQQGLDGLYPKGADNSTMT